MPDQPLHSPAAAAQLIPRPPTGEPVNVHTLRRWCAQHAQHLSPGANPNAGKEGGDAARWLTDRDIEVLRTVAELRGAGAGTEAINAKLATMSFAVVVEGEQDATEVAAEIATVDANPSDNPLQRPTQALAPVDHGQQIIDLWREVEAIKTRHSAGYAQLITGIVLGIFATVVAVALLSGGAP